MSGRNDQQPQENQAQNRKEKEKAPTKTLEEQLAELESEDSEIEDLKRKQQKKRLFNDQQWKILIGVFGSGIILGLIIMTLNMVEQLLSGGSSG